MLVYVMAIWYINGHFWYICWSFFPVLVFCSKENLATLLKTRLSQFQFDSRRVFGSEPGLPDGLFSNQKSQIGVNFGGPLNGKCWYIL
jgi:hypothetical protein